MRRQRNAGRRQKALLASIVVTLLSCVLDARGQQSDEETAALFDTGIVERSGVTLMLLDVEVLSKKGNPVRGLRIDDFGIQINGREQPIYSLDDLCRPSTALRKHAIGPTPTSWTDSSTPPAAAACSWETRAATRIRSSSMAR